MAQTIFMSSSVSDQKSISSSSSSSSNNQQLKKQPSGTRNNFMCRPIHDQNKAPTNIIHGGLLRPPQTYASLPIPFYGSYQERQPPLLPLPPPKSIHASLPTRAVQNLSSPSSSYSPTSNRSKINRNRDHQSLTPKKSKSKRPEKNEDRRKSKEIEYSKPTKGLGIESVGPSGPDPTDLPRDVPKVFLAPPSMVVKVNDFSGYPNDLSGSVFTLAPPPSSLPLPKFSLRPKGSCNAEAAKTDAGATNDLRRLLRLR